MASASPGCAVPKAGPSGASIDVASLVAAWPLVVAAFEKRSRRVGSAFAKARVVAVTGDVMTLAIGAADAVSKGVLRERDTAEMSRAVTRVVVGVALRPVVDDEARAPAPVVAASSAAATSSPTAGSPVPGSSGAGVQAPGSAAIGASAASVVGSVPRVEPRAPAPTPAGGSMAGSGLDEVRSHPTVKAVLDAFGARVLAVQTVEGAADAARGPA
jgi:hypothetical protein